MTFLTNLEDTGILCRLDLVIEGKAGREIPESRLEFLEKFSTNNFTLADAKDNTSGSLNRKGREELPLLRTPLIICLKSRE